MKNVCDKFVKKKCLQGKISLFIVFLCVSGVVWCCAGHTSQLAASPPYSRGATLLILEI